MSFNAELKDFIAGAKAGRDFLGSDKDEYYRAATAEKKQNMAFKADAWKRAQMPNTGLIDEARKTGAAVKGQALPIDPDPDPLKVRPQAAIPTPMEGDYSPEYAEHGGPVGEIKFADGGEVMRREDDMAPLQGEPPPPQPPQQQAIPEEGQAGDVLPENAQPTEGQADHGIAALLAAGHKAVKEGLQTVQANFGLNRRSAMPDPNRQPSMRGYLTGDGAAPRSDMDQVLKIIDPEGKMSESERNLAALGAVYNYYSVRDPKKAQTAAATMVQYLRTATARYNSLAAAHAQAGDVDGAVKNMAKAFANIPNGQDVKFQKRSDGSYAYSMIDEQTGEVVNKGIASPRQVASMAMRMTPGEFDKWILTAAGQRAAKATGPSKAFQSGMGGLGGGAAPATPAGAATPPQGDAGGVEYDEDDTDEEGDSPATDLSSSNRGAIPAEGELITKNAAMTGQDSAAPQTSGPPKFDTNAYSQMTPKEQSSYTRAYNARLNEWKASQPKPGKKEQGEKPLKPGDRAKFGELINNAWDAQVEAMTPDGGDAPKFKKQEVVRFKESADDIMSHPQNGRMPASTAVGAVLSLTSVDPKNPEAMNFSVPEDGKKPDGAMITLKNGRNVFVPKDTLVGLMTMRAEKMAAAKKIKEKEEGTSKRNQETVTAAGQAASTVAQATKRGVGAMSGVPGMYIDAVKGAIPIVGNALKRGTPRSEDDYSGVQP